MGRVLKHPVEVPKSSTPPNDPLRISLTRVSDTLQKNFQTVPKTCRGTFRPERHRRMKGDSGRGSHDIFLDLIPGLLNLQAKAPQAALVRSRYFIGNTKLEFQGEDIAKQMSSFKVRTHCFALLCLTMI